MIRRLMPADWAAFRDIRLDSLRTAPEAFGSTHDEWAAKSERDIRDWLTQMHCFAKTDAGRCLSVGAWHPIGGPVTHHRAHVIAVFTRSTARGQGLFSAVMQAIEADIRAHAMRQIELDVSVINTVAHAAYLRAGFRDIAILPDALCHGGVYADQIVMHKRLLP